MGQFSFWLRGHICPQQALPDRGRAPSPSPALPLGGEAGSRRGHECEAWLASGGGRTTRTAQEGLQVSKNSAHLSVSSSYPLPQNQCTEAMIDHVMLSTSNKAA